ncbi:M48 family metallopeptidase [Engelhardtia mirabilis]|uniref:Peptidase M48 domain-containing protein n=1 Tax=Engelhardtia mirabilis TaxID=2528011 RepID=A0A518BT04_9BACT|nr:hypothetical protein Pla133_52260 [Planctomycetes bacterium Pla133]QDV04428.1 hypothetical protein Pla86_52230 [Planctomycetes bacterium Pla86]
MTFLLHLLAALGLAAAVEFAGPHGAIDPWTRTLPDALVALVLVLPVPHLLGLATRLLAIRGRFHAARVVGAALGAAGVATYGVVVLAGWGAFARAVGGEGASVLGWPGPGFLLLLAPFVLLQVAAIDARARLNEPRGPRRRSHRAFQLRMLGASVAPLLAYVTLSTAIGLYAPLRVHLEEVALLGSAFVAAVLVLFGVGLPSLLRRVWDTTPLPEGPLREMFTDLARRARFRCGELLVWRTGGSVANAAIVGFTPGQRVVLMTDGLLAQLGPRELRAVFGHEMGHSARRHVLIFAAWTLLVFLGLDLALTRVPAIAEADATLVTLAAAATWFVSFGYLSRRAELEADLFALELLGDPADMVRALDEISGGPSRWRHGWRHFSVAHRILFMRAAAADPRVGLRLRRGMRRFSGLVACLLALIATLWVAVQWGELPAQRAVAELRLGHYSAAAKLAAAAGGERPELRALAGRAAGLERDGVAPDPDELVSLAGGALDRDDPVGSKALLWLAALRGSSDAKQVLGALEDGFEARPSDLEQLPTGWKSRLLRLFEADPKLHPASAVEE